MDPNEEDHASDHEENNSDEEALEVNDESDSNKRQNKLRSVVWEHFRVNKDGQNVCLHCKHAVVARDRNTSNLFSHLRTKHPDKYEAAVKAKKQQQEKKRNHCTSNPSTSTMDIKQSFSRMGKHDKKSKRWKQITNAVTVYLVKDMVPIYSVEKPRFKQLVGTLDKQYELPSRKYFTKTAIPTLYNTTRDTVASEISDVRYFSATTDLWSSEGMKPYLSYTIHFICNWKLQSRCLQTSFMPEDHTSENLAEAMKCSLEGWELDESKQVCLTTDSGANIVNAASRLDWMRLSCFGHNLHLAITNSIKCDNRFTRALGLARKIVSIFSMSWKKRRDLAKAQTDNGLPSHTLVADCPTRWGSIQKMVSRILEQVQAIRIVLSADWKFSHLLPTWQDTEVLEAINSVLSSLDDLTDFLSGEDYVSISSIRSVIKHIHEEALVEREDDVSLVRDMKRQIRTDLDSRYIDTKVNHLLDISSFLDPRFKLQYIVEENHTAFKEAVINEGLDIFDLAVEAEETDSVQSSVASTSDERPPGPPPKKKSKLAKILKSSNDSEQQKLTPRDKVVKEVRSYTDRPCIDVEDDPLQWWS